MRSRLRDSGVLAGASLITGLLAYVFFALSTRALGATDAAPVSVLWTYWGFASAAFTFPLQQWVVRSISAHRDEAHVREALPRVAGLIVGVAVGMGVLAWLGRDTLFDSDAAAFPALVVVVTLGSGFIGLVRGSLAARRRFTSLAIALVAENGVRVVAAAVLWASGTTDAVWYGLVLALGASVGLLWPTALRFSGAVGGVGVAGAGAAGAGAAGAGAGEASGVGRVHESAVSFLGGAASGQLISQVVLTGAPVVLALSGGSAADVTVLFAALALFRAPYQVALVVVARITGGVTARYVGGRGGRASVARLRRGVLLAAVVGTPLGAAVGAVLGPPLLPWIFGSDVELSAGLCAVIAAGSTVALVNLMLTVMVMAQARTWRLVGSWLAAVAAGALVVVAASGSAGSSDELVIVCWAFAVAEAVAFAALVVSERLERTP